MDSTNKPPLLLVVSSNKRGTRNYQRFDNLATGAASVGHTNIGKVNVDCRLLFKKSRWGVIGPAKTPAGIIYMDVDVQCPPGVRLMDVRVLLTLEDVPMSGDSVNLNEVFGDTETDASSDDVAGVRCHFTDFFGPRFLTFGQSPTLLTAPSICQVDETTVSVRTEKPGSVSGRLIPGKGTWEYKTLEWAITTNEAESSGAKPSGLKRLHLAFAYEHSRKPHALKVEVNGKLESFEQRLKRKLKFGPVGRNSERCVTIIGPVSNTLSRPLDELAHGLARAMEMENMSVVPTIVPDPLLRAQPDAHGWQTGGHHHLVNSELRRPSSGVLERFQETLDLVLGHNSEEPEDIFFDALEVTDEHSRNGPNSLDMPPGHGVHLAADSHIDDLEVDGENNEVTQETTREPVTTLRSTQLDSDDDFAQRMITALRTNANLRQQMKQMLESPSQRWEELSESGILDADEDWKQVDGANLQQEGGMSLFEEEAWDANLANARTADQWFERLRRVVHEQLSLNLPPEEAPKIAILDSGLDMNHSMIRAQKRRILKQKSFLNGDISTSDDHGHGTFIANLLFDVAPHACLIIARVTKGPHLPSDGGSGVAHAVRWAIKERVDMISMSFGLADKVYEIQEAIDDAATKNILVFSAARNDGANRLVAFPARRSNVFAIFATDPFGVFSRSTPTGLPGRFSFSVLGEAVQSAWPHSTNKGFTVRKSGTSFSTPIAVGIAALVIEYVRQKILPQADEGEKKRIQELKSRPGMEAVMKLISSESHGYHYLNLAQFIEGNSPGYVRESILKVLGEA